MSKQILQELPKKPKDQICLSFKLKLQLDEEKKAITPGLIATINKDVQQRITTIGNTGINGVLGYDELHTKLITYAKLITKTDKAKKYPLQSLNKAKIDAVYYIGDPKSKEGKKVLGVLAEKLALVARPLIANPDKVIKRNKTKQSKKYQFDGKFQNITPFRNQAEEIFIYLQAYIEKHKKNENPVVIVFNTDFLEKIHTIALDRITKENFNKEELKHPEKTELSSHDSLSSPHSLSTNNINCTENKDDSSKESSEIDQGEKIITRSTTQDTRQIIGEAIRLCVKKAQNDGFAIEKQNNMVGESLGTIQKTHNIQFTRCNYMIDGGGYFVIYKVSGKSYSASYNYQELLGDLPIKPALPPRGYQKNTFTNTIPTTSSSNTANYLDEKHIETADTGNSAPPPLPPRKPLGLSPNLPSPTVPAPLHSTLSTTFSSSATSTNNRVSLTHRPSQGGYKKQSTAVSIADKRKKILDTIADNCIKEKKLDIKEIIIDGIKINVLKEKENKNELKVGEHPCYKYTYSEILACVLDKNLKISPKVKEALVNKAESGIKENDWPNFFDILAFAKNNETKFSAKADQSWNARVIDIKLFFNNQCYAIQCLEDLANISLGRLTMIRVKKDSTEKICPYQCNDTTNSKNINEIVTNKIVNRLVLFNINNKNDIEQIITDQFLQGYILPNNVNGMAFSEVATIEKNVQLALKYEGQETGGTIFLQLNDIYSAIKTAKNEEKKQEETEDASKENEEKREKLLDKEQIERRVLFHIHELLPENYTSFSAEIQKVLRNEQLNNPIISIYDGPPITIAKLFCSNKNCLFITCSYTDNKQQNIEHRFSCTQREFSKIVDTEKVYSSFPTMTSISSLSEKHDEESVIEHKEEEAELDKARVSAIKTALGDEFDIDIDIDLLSNLIGKNSPEQLEQTIVTVDASTGLVEHRNIFFKKVITANNKAKIEKAADEYKKAVKNKLASMPSNEQQLRASDTSSSVNLNATNHNLT